jgi:hypothetical protein
MKPDFSGEWILDRQASALSSNAAAFQTGVMRIEHRDPIFRFQLSMVADDKPVEHAGEGLTDGKEVAGEGTLTRLYWDGDMLVISCESESRDAQWAMSFRYELLDERRRLRWSEQIRGGGRDQEIPGCSSVDESPEPDKSRSVYRFRGPRRGQRASSWNLSLAV